MPWSCRIQDGFGPFTDTHSVAPNSDPFNFSSSGFENIDENSFNEFTDFGDFQAASTNPAVGGHVFTPATANGTSSSTTPAATTTSSSSSGIGRSSNGFMNVFGFGNNFADEPHAAPLSNTSGGTTNPRRAANVSSASSDFDADIEVDIDIHDQVSPSSSSSTGDGGDLTPTAGSWTFANPSKRSGSGSGSLGSKRGGGGGGGSPQSGSPTSGSGDSSSVGSFGSIGSSNGENDGGGSMGGVGINTGEVVVLGDSVLLEEVHHVKAGAAAVASPVSKGTLPVALKVGKERDGAKEGKANGPTKKESATRTALGLASGLRERLASFTSSSKQASS